jgi:hypothetical protein
MKLIAIGRSPELPKLRENHAVAHVRKKSGEISWKKERKGKEQCEPVKNRDWIRKKILFPCATHTTRVCEMAMK